MRFKAYILAFSLLVGISILAEADSPGFYFRYASFATPGGETYIENYLAVMGNTVKFVKDKNNKYQGKVQVSVFYLKGDSIRKLNRHNVLSPEIDDTTKRVDFIDIQRYWLPKGAYVLQIKVQDLNDTANHTFIKGKINIGYSRHT